MDFDTESAFFRSGELDFTDTSGDIVLTLKKLSDRNPDFLKAVHDPTASGCDRLKEFLVPPANVYCQSVAVRLNWPGGGKFPLNLTNRFVGLLDGKMMGWFLSLPCDEKKDVMKFG